MTKKILSTLRSFVANRGPIFLINQVFLVALTAWLLLKIAHSGFGLEKSYAIVRVVALGCVVIFFYLSLQLGRRGNARLLVCFAAACLAGEFLMRVMGSYGVGAHNDQSWREPRPYFMFGGPSGGVVTFMPQLGEGTVRLNTEGFRIDREIVSPKPEDELRIFVLGGSTVLGGRSPSTTIPGMVETHLQSGGLRRARVYNFGVVSFVSGQELSLLAHRLIDLKPDLVIAYDGGNDLFEPWFYDPRPGYPFNYLTEEEAMSAQANTLGAAKTVASFARDSALLQALFGTLGLSDRIWARTADLRDTVKWKSAEWRQAVVGMYARNVTAMCRLARGYDALFAAFFQPMLPYSTTLDGSAVAISGGDIMVQGLREQRAMVPEIVGRQFPAASVEEGCLFSDLSALLEDRPEAFSDIIHVDDKANQLIAQRLANVLLDWRALRSNRNAR